MSNKSLLSAVATATVGALSLAQTANAALVIDLRFAPTGSQAPGNNATNGASYSPDGKTATLTTLSPVVIYAYAKVTGSTASDEGLQSATFAVQSLINSAGITGSLTAAARRSSWNGSGSNAGSSSNLSPDGLGDWGSTSALNVSTGSVFRVRTNLTRGDAAGNPIDFGFTTTEDEAQGLGGGASTGTFTHLDANGGEEFLVGAFVFTPTAIPANSSITYNGVIPAAGSIAAGTWWEDSTNYTTANPPDGAKVPSNGAYSIASGVNFVTGIPEPTSLGLAGLAGLGLLRRRRA